MKQFKIQRLLKSLFYILTLPAFKRMWLIISHSMFLIVAFSGLLSIYILLSSDLRCSSSAFRLGVFWLSLFLPYQPGSSHRPWQSYFDLILVGLTETTVLWRKAQYSSGGYCKLRGWSVHKQLSFMFLLPHLLFFPQETGILTY